jgi:pyruvate/2-oxoglutarate dehydrogenase complex dihydrolipoamide dehydrogenase (E3) component
MNVPSQLNRSFDLLVIGSGAAGGGAAEVAHAAGRSVAIIEKDKVGGDCPNYACVPTKALLRSAKVYALLKRAGEFGLRARAVGFEWAKVLARKEWIVRHTGAATAEQQYQQEGIALFKGAAAFEDEHHVRVDGQVVRGDKIMIATGSKPAMPRIPGIEAAKPITSVEAVSLRRLPASLIIIGGGPVGCEFAQLFSTFGVQVIMLEMANTILPHEEPELSQIIHQTLELNGANIVTAIKVMQLTQDGRRKMVQTRVKGEIREFEAEEILMAAGREPQTAELRLDAIGVGIDGGGRVKIDEYLQTTQPHIYAGGDVSGPLLFTHVAHYQGALAGMNMWSGTPRRADYRVVPRVTFTEPEIASVGLTEEQARQQGCKVGIGTYDIGYLGKALVESEDIGLIKLIADVRSGAILGGDIVPPAAGEMIQQIVAAMTARERYATLRMPFIRFPHSRRVMSTTVRSVSCRRKS